MELNVKLIVILQLVDCPLQSAMFYFFMVFPLVWSFDAVLAVCECFSSCLSLFCLGRMLS